MSPIRRADPKLDALIDETTADAHDEDEVLMGFEGFFDEQAHFRAPAPSSARISRCCPSPLTTTVAS